MPALNSEFVIDDRTYFLDNDLLTSLKPWQLTTIFLEPSNYWGELLPIRDLLYVVEYNLFGKNPMGYHVVSLILYLLTGWVVYQLVFYAANLVNFEKNPAATARTKWLALFATGFFLLHPLHVESVVPIMGQKDLLVGLFSLASILFAVKILIKKSPNSWPLISAFILCYYAAFLSKNLAIATTLVITLLGMILIRNRRKLLPGYLSYWALINIPCALYILQSINTINQHSEKMIQIVNIAFIDRILRGLQIFGHHFELAAWPNPLNFGYPFSYSGEINIHIIIGILGIGTGIILFAYCKDLLIRMALLLVVCYLIPVSQIFVDLFNASVYDRYLYLPVLGFGILVWKGTDFLIPSKLQSSFMISILVALIVLTIQQIPVYKNDVAVTKQSYAIFPGWGSSSFNYADALIEAGELDQAQKLVETEPTMRKPAWVQGYFLGWIALERGQTDMAIRLLKKSARLCALGGYYSFPSIPLARALLVKGENEQAHQVLKVILNSKIKNPLGYYQARQLDMAASRN